MSNKRVAALAQALKTSGKTPTEIVTTLGLDAALLQPKEDEMSGLSRATASRIVLALKANNALAMDANIDGITEILRQIEGLEGDRRPRAFDTETAPNGGVPAWLKEHPDDADDAFDSREEEEEDNAADRRARDARHKLGRDESEEESERREEEEEKEADDALREAEDAHREAEDAKLDAEDRKRAEDRHRRAMDRLRRMGADAHRRAEDRKHARDRRREAEDARHRARDAGLEPPDLYKPDTSKTLDAHYEEDSRRHARDRRHLSRDYRRARDAHRRAHDIWRRHADDYHRAHDACKEAEDRRREAEDAKRADDAKRAEDACREAEDRMKRAAEDARRAEDALHRARDARMRARDARRAHDRRRADDEPPELKPFQKTEGDRMVTKAAMDAAITNALRDNDLRHRDIDEALEIVRAKVGRRIAMDGDIRSVGDVYARGLDILQVPHSGITQLAALKQLFMMAAKPGSENTSRSGFAMDSAPSSATDFQRFKQLFPAAANIQRM